MTSKSPLFFIWCILFLSIILQDVVLSSMFDWRWEEPESSELPAPIKKHDKKCIKKNTPSPEEFLMKLRLCRKNVSITCDIGGKSICHKDRESFKATAIITKSRTQCLIEANTTDLKYIRFIVKAKYLKNLNELGSRGLGGDEDEYSMQRGKCTLGYTCIGGNVLKDIRVSCNAFHYDERENPFNGTQRKFVWQAPEDYRGPVWFRSVVQVSYNYFYMDIATAEIFTKEEDS